MTLHDLFFYQNVVNYYSVYLFYGFPYSEPLKTQSVLKILPKGVLYGKSIKIIELLLNEYIILK